MTRLTMDFEFIQLDLNFAAQLNDANRIDNSNNSTVSTLPKAIFR